MPRPHPRPELAERRHALLRQALRRVSHRGIRAFFQGLALLLVAAALVVVALRAPAAVAGPSIAAALVALARGQRRSPSVPPSVPGQHGDRRPRSPSGATGRPSGRRSHHVRS